MKAAQFIIFIFALAACSNGGSESASPRGNGIVRIPDKIGLDEKTLTPISSEEFATAKAFFITNNTSSSLVEHVLISVNENSTERQRRLADYAELTDTQKAAIQTIQDRCETQEEPKSSTSITFRQHLYTTDKAGQTCPVSFETDLSSSYTIIERDGRGQNGKAQIDGSVFTHAEYKTTELAQISEVTREEIRSTVAGLSEIHPGRTSTYLKIVGQGQVDVVTQNLGRVDLALKVESLEGDGIRHVIAYFEVITKSQTFHYAIHALARTGDIPSAKEFYIGNRLLTEQEMIDVKADRFVRGF